MAPWWPRLSSLQKVQPSAPAVLLLSLSLPLRFQGSRESPEVRGEGNDLQTVFCSERSILLIWVQPSLFGAA